MALIKCEECKKKISDTTQKCVHCGYPLKQNIEKKNISNIYVWLTAILPIVVILFIWLVIYITNYEIVGLLLGVVLILVLEISFINIDNKILIENGIDTSSFFKNKFNFVIPKYLYKRAQILSDNLSYFIVWIITFAIFAVVILLGIYPFDNNYVDKVKDGNLYLCPNYTVEELVNNYLDNPKWESGKTIDGYKAVNIKGNIMLDGEKSAASIQYYIEDKDDEFDFHAFELDGNPQSEYLYYELIEDMCSNMNTSSNTNNDSTKEHPSTEPIDDVSDYDISEFEQVSMLQLINKFEKDEIQVIFFGTKKCRYCVEMIAHLKKAQSTYEFKTLYLDVEQNAKSSRGYDDVIEKLDMPYEGSTGETEPFGSYYGFTPMLAIIKNGEMLDGTIGLMDYAVLEDFLENNGLNN